MTAPTPISMRERLRTDYQWTPRQREVLALITRGKSNTEIAEALGVSLAGAKWHVGEILSKLQAEQREEAADYWRRYNGLAPRFARVFRGMLGVLGTKLAAGVAVAVAGLAAAIIIAVALNQSREEHGASERSGAAATVTSTADPRSTTVSPTSQGNAAGPSGATLGTKDGLPIYELVVSPQSVALPDGGALYFQETCAVCSGGELFRWRQDVSGAWQRTLLLGADDSRFPRGYPFGNFVSDGGGRFAVLWCLTDQGGCGKKHDGTKDTTPRAILVSSDAGVTWTEVARVDALTSVTGFLGEDLVVSLVDETTREATFKVLASARILSHAEVEPLSRIPGANIDVAVSGESVISLANESSTFVRVGAGAPVEEAYYAFPGGHLWLGYALSATQYLGVADRNEKAALNPPNQHELGGVPRLPVVVDLSKRSVSPIEGLTPASDFAWIESRLFAAGPFAEVETGGDCLNVRESPSTSAKSLVCSADRVLLRDLGETTAADGTTWLKVATFDGRTGWASLEYLRR